MTLYKEDKATKKNRFIAIAMAGAMMSGAFAVAVPVSAEDTTITGDSYTLVIPTSATVTDASGFNALGVTIKSCSNDVNSVTVTVSSSNDWKLLSSGENTVEYGLYDSNDSTNTANEHEFSNYNKITSSEGETWNCGIKLTGYSDSISTGTYTDTITWTATVNAPTNSDSTDNGNGAATVNDISDDTDGSTDTSASGENAGTNVSDTTSTGETTEKTTGTDVDSSDSTSGDGTEGSTTTTGDDVSGSTGTTEISGSSTSSDGGADESTSGNTTDTGAAGSTNSDGTASGNVSDTTTD